MVLAMLLIFTALITPFEMGFLDSEVPKINILFFVNRLVDAGFCTDIWINFTTAYYDEARSTWVKDPLKVALAYFRGSFLLDLTSSVPWDLLTFGVDLGEGGSSMKLLRLLKILKLTKLARIYRASKMLIRLKSRSNMKSADWNLLKFITIVLVVTHWTACAWGCFPQFSSVRSPIQLDTNSTDDGAGRILKGGGSAGASEMDWAADGDGLDQDVDWKTRMEVQMGPLSVLDLYGLSLDYALSVMCMGYGTIAASNPSEIWFSIACMIFAGSTYAYVIGGVCEALSNEDPADAEYREALDRLNGFFRAQSVTLEVRAECMQYMQLYRTKVQLDNYNSTLLIFTPMMRQKLAVVMMDKMLADSSVLKWCDKGEVLGFKAEMATRLEAEIYPKYEKIFNAGEISDRMYIIRSGVVRRNYHLSRKESVCLVIRGQCFGWEMVRNVIFGGGNGVYLRDASTHCFTACSLMALSCNSLKEVLADEKFAKTALRVRAAARWVLLRTYFIELGAAMMRLKDAAGLPLMSHHEKQLLLEFHRGVAQDCEAHRKPTEPVDDCADPEQEVGAVVIYIYICSKALGSGRNRQCESVPLCIKAQCN
jgi:CRP-like cAMP-binding protein